MVTIQQKACGRKRHRQEAEVYHFLLNRQSNYLTCICFFAAPPLLLPPKPVVRNPLLVLFTPILRLPHSGQRGRVPIGKKGNITRIMTAITPTHYDLSANSRSKTLSRINQPPKKSPRPPVANLPTTIPHLLNQTEKQ